MKKIIFTILLSIVATSFYAQRNNLLEDGRRWVTLWTSLDDIDDEFVKEIISIDGYTPIRNITINGDTIINDTIYKKLYATELLFNLSELNTSGKLEAFLRCDKGKYLYRFFDENLKEKYKKEYPNEFIGDEYIMFDENSLVGDTVISNFEVISAVSDTIYPRYSDYLIKYWKTKPLNNELIYSYFFNDIKWIQGIGYPTTLLLHDDYDVDCLCEDLLLFCIAANGDTIYRNKKYWYPELAMTTIGKISASQVSFKQQGGECIVTLPGEAAAWSATLSNSNGITVARRSGEGSEIILPATSKGTHILVVKADGKVVKKKVFIK